MYACILCVLIMLISRLTELSSVQLFTATATNSFEI